MARKHTPPPLLAVDDALAELDESFLICRDVHHAWAVAAYRAAGNGTVERTLECERCGTERVDAWTMSGVRVTAHYHYAEGYAFKNVDNATDRTAMRREVLRRAGVGGRTTARKRRR